MNSSLSQSARSIHEDFPNMQMGTEQHARSLNKLLFFYSIIHLTVIYNNKMIRNMWSIELEVLLCYTTVFYDEIFVRNTTKMISLWPSLNSSSRVVRTTPPPFSTSATCGTEAAGRPLAVSSSVAYQGMCSVFRCLLYNAFYKLLCFILTYFYIGFCLHNLFACCDAGDVVQLVLVSFFD